ncbi:hypothetical protein [Mycobacterium sp.]|uniref:hypothetical protein n=1 Tax=Mycobacterium sp. TaxID=1785 RepID=UPI003F9D1EA8
MTAEPHFHFTDPDRLVECFLYSLTLLATVDDGLAAGHDLKDLDAVAWLCGLVKLIGSACRTPEDVLLCSLADKTEALLVSELIPVDGDVVKDWLKARAELVSCRLGAL